MSELREALDRLIPEFEMELTVKIEDGRQVVDFPLDTFLDKLTLPIERALRAAAMEMNAVHGWGDDEVFEKEINRCIAAGVAALILHPRRHRHD